MHFLYLYLVSIPVFIILDLLWLGVIAKGIYQSQLGYLLGPVNWPAAVAFYLIFLAGLTFFATYPAYAGGTLYTAVLMGALFGFFAYATYDLTNLATIKNWPPLISLVDIMWGAIIGGAVAGAGYTIAKALF